MKDNAPCLSAYSIPYFLKKETSSNLEEDIFYANSVFITEAWWLPSLALLMPLLMQLCIFVQFQLLQ